MPAERPTAGVRAWQFAPPQAAFILNYLPYLPTLPTYLGCSARPPSARSAHTIYGLLTFPRNLAPLAASARPRRPWIATRPPQVPAWGFLEQQAHGETLVQGGGGWGVKGRHRPGMEAGLTRAALLSSAARSFPPPGRGRALDRPQGWRGSNAWKDKRRKTFGFAAARCELVRCGPCSFEVSICVQLSRGELSPRSTAALPLSFSGWR
jgi:hypothetical protein